MKAHLAWRILAALACGVLGFLVGTVRERRQTYSQMSLAGQTLQDVSRALELERAETGSYPSTLAGLTIASSSPEFSKTVLSKVLYHQTETGYVALVGLPKAVWILPGISPQFQ